MCGIHGILSLRDGDQPDPTLLQCMGNATVHRGPDDSGEYVGQGLLLGQRRLSIIDLSTGRQPIPNEDETIWGVCNGEIYNFQALREGLKAQGHRFRTGSDSEVILHLYEQHGNDFVARLDGMFALAIWDSPRRRLLLARDRLGIKPLYYRNDGRRLTFASEAKSILALPGMEARLASQAVAEYLSLGYTPAPHSIFDGIQKLPPATLMVCQNGECRSHRYWRLPEAEDRQRSERDWVEAVHETLDAAVSSQMVSDVPLGAFLSGGIDSSTVVALMAGHSEQPVKTYAIGFDDSSGGGYYNELPYARQVARLFGTEHKEIIVKPDVVALLPKLLWHMDEPIADAAFITTYLVSKFARQDVTVILSGVGGDELFGGYRRYQGEHYGRYYARLPAWLRRGLIAPLARRLPADRHSPLLNLSRYARAFVLSSEQSLEDRYRSYVQVFSREQRDALLAQLREQEQDALDRGFDEVSSQDPVQRLMQVDLLTQLPDDLLLLTDKMSMATSLECRVPLLDQGLVELAARMPARLKVHGRELKFILKQALADLLPKEILYRKKRGFGAPMGAWLKDELSPLLRSVLSRESVERRGLFDWETVERTIAWHEASREDYTDHLLSLMNLELWSRLYLDGTSAEDLSEQLKAGSLN